MSIANAVVKTGTTAIISATGGSDVTLKSLGDNIGRHELRFGGSSMADRNYVTMTANKPKVSLDSPSGYTQERTGFILKVPKELSDGTIVINTLRVQLATDVNTTDAEKLDMCFLGAQLLGQDDFADFWQSRDTN
jgi:hypothetical protein